MNKNERLLELLGDISPVYLAEAERCDPELRKHRPFPIRKMVSLIAAMVAIAMLSFALGINASALAPSEEQPKYKTGSILTDIPVILAAEDYEAMQATIQKNIADKPELMIRYRRYDSFYTKQSLDQLAMYKNEGTREKVRATLIQTYPIVQLTDIYTVDISVTENEKEAILYWLMCYAELTQEDLMDMYQRLYDIVAQSKLTEEEKTVIYQSLPEIPTITDDAPHFFWEIGEFVEQVDLQLPLASLPRYMTVEDYETLIASLEDMEKADESDIRIPQELWYQLGRYQKYPRKVSKDQEDLYERVLQYIAPICEQMEIYVLDPYMTLDERTLMCYYLGIYTDLLPEDLYGYTENVHKALIEADPEKASSWINRLLTLHEVVKK